MILVKKSLLVPEGWYPVTIANAEQKAGTKGPYIQLELTVNEGESKGKTLKFQTVSFSENSIWRAIQFLEAIHDTTYAEGEEVPFDLDTDVPDLMGQTCAVHVTVESYVDKQGQSATRNTVVAYKPLAYLEQLASTSTPSESEYPF